MGNAVPTPAPPGDSRAYKRSWRNLLINKQVQLRFTLFMVGLSAVLMILLGAWVKLVADNTTEVGLARVRGEVCPPLPDGAPAAPSAAGAAIDTPSASPSDPAVPSEVLDPPATSAPASPAERPRSRVQVDETSMTITPTQAPPPAPAADLRTQVLAHHECEMRQAGLIADLEARRRDIVWVLFGSGFFLCIGLAIFGIKMTHRVAGPLHKISLYFGKMKEGRYSPAAPLRKGDELTELYEHFKAAAEGLRRAEASDLERIRAVVAAAKGADAGPELAQLLAELSTAAQRKEKSLE